MEGAGEIRPCPHTPPESVQVPGEEEEGVAGKRGRREMALIVVSPTVSTRIISSQHPPH